jgi:hypothetical protein
MRVLIRLTAVLLLTLSPVVLAAQAVKDGAAAPARIDSAVQAYCASWGAPSAPERAQLIKSALADSATYSDATPRVLAGVAGLVTAIEDFQKRRPGGRFRCSKAQTHHNVFRFTWQLLDASGKVALTGMDFGELDPSGHILRLVGFFGPPPELAP